MRKKGGETRPESRPPKGLPSDDFHLPRSRRTVQLQPATTAFEPAWFALELKDMPAPQSPTDVSSRPACPRCGRETQSANCARSAGIQLHHVTATNDDFLPIRSIAKPFPRD